MEEEMNPDTATIHETFPIGATPYGHVARERINELIGAIARYANDAPMTEDTVKSATLWAIELRGQLDLLHTLLIYDS